MKLVTKEIEQKLLAAASDGEKPPAQTEIICKFFVPWGAGTWWVTEATRRDDGEMVLFGFATLGDPQCAELGSVLLSELEAVRGPGGLRIERDLYYGPHTLADVLREHGKSWA